MKVLQGIGSQISKQLAFPNIFTLNLSFFTSVSSRLPIPRIFSNDPGNWDSEIETGIQIEEHYHKSWITIIYFSTFSVLDNYCIVYKPAIYLVGVWGLFLRIKHLHFVTVAVCILLF